MLLKKFEEAKSAFVKSASVGNKENKNVVKMTRDCDIELEKLRQQEKVMYQKMFKKVEVEKWKESKNGKGNFVPKDVQDSRKVKRIKKNVGKETIKKLWKLWHFNIWVILLT